MIILVTGGAGFIGSALIRHLINDTKHEVINVDKLTYAGNLESLASVSNSSRYHFEQVDICDVQKLTKIINQYQPDAIMHLAAESHVDRSIDGPATFIETNFVGTYILLEATRRYYNNLSDDGKNKFRFHHVSTDEVYGDLEEGESSFSENTPYRPSSPYSASKAGADHLVCAWHRTYGLPVLITNCSNNYGPYQYPEKFIPLMILNAVQGKPLPVYGNGENVRDWLFVEDHVRALMHILVDGLIGETYNIGANNEKKNIEVLENICNILDMLKPVEASGVRKHRELIVYVEDRPGHDKRYAINSSKIEKTIGWKSSITFDDGLYKTIEWYLDNRKWCDSFQNTSSHNVRLGLKL